MSESLMSIEEEKSLAKQVLDKFKVIDPGAVIAGGAPRDWYMEKSCNDIDIYLRAPFHKTEHHRNTIFDQFNLLANTIKPTDENYASVPGLLAVYEFDFKGKQFNVMFMEAGIEPPFTQHFSCSICEIAYNGYNFLPSKRFKNTIDTGDIFLADGYEGTEKHIQKMMKRFPEYRFVKVIRSEVNCIPIEVKLA